MADVTSTFAAKDVGFTSTVNRMQRTLQGFQSGIAGFGAKVAGLAAAFVGVQQSIAAFRSGLDMAGRLNDLSKTTGEAAGNLAVLERAFQNNGMAAEQVGVSLAKMSEFIVGLRSGSESASKAAAAMGISLSDLAGKSPIQQMQAIMQAIAGIRDPALRTATAVDVFGRSGRAVVPLASEFSGEMANARAELGSLVPILNESGASLDELGDKLTNSIGNKLTELAIGFAAGVTGANNFVDALSKIDAAGFGKDVGDALRVAFNAPHETAKAIGQTLIGGVKDAGNHLLAFIERAREAYYNMLQNPGFYSGLQKFLEGMFAQVGKVFSDAIIGGIESAMSLMDWNPFWKPLIDIAKNQLKNIQGDIAIAGEAAANQMEQGATQMKAAFNEGAKATQLIVKDALGAQQHYEKAAEHLMAANDQASEIEKKSAATKENYQQGSAALRDALAEVRGFDLMPKAGPEERPDWFKSNQPPPKNEPTPAATNTPNFNNRSTFGNVVDAKLTQSQRVSEMRAAAAEERNMSRFSELMAGRQFRSAARVEERARRASDRINSRQERRDLMEDMFGGANNLGEALRNFENEARNAGMTPDDALSRMGIDRAVGESRRDALGRFIDDMTKPEGQRQREESDRKIKMDDKESRASDKSAENIYEWLTGKFFEEFQKRLPQQAMI